MSSLPPLGTTIIGYTYEGRPIVLNPDGSVSTERGITVTDPRLNAGAPTNIPSMWGGKELDGNSSILQALQSGQSYRPYSSIEEAVRQSILHSQQVGQQLDQGRYWHGQLPTPTAKPRE